jgi:hypothetical protein
MSSGESDVTIILKPFPGAKRWQHYQRQQGPAGAELAVEDNYTVILGSHRNSKLKIEKNGDEKATVSSWLLAYICCNINPGQRLCLQHYYLCCITLSTMQLVGKDCDDCSSAGKWSSRLHSEHWGVQNLLDQLCRRHYQHWHGCSWQLHDLPMGGSRASCI